MTVDPIIETAPRVVIRPGDAYELALLLRLGARHARSDGWRPSARTAAVIAAVEQLDQYRTAPPPPPVPVADDVRIDVAAAAGLLGVSERQVRNLAPRIPRSVRVRGRWVLALDEVLAEAEARQVSETVGTAV